MDSYLLTSTRTPCPRPLHPIPAPSLPPPALSRRDPRPHLVALGIPPTTAAASRGHPAPLRGYLDPKRNGAFIPWREVCEPFPVRGGTEVTEPSLCSLGAWRCSAPNPKIRSHVPSSGSPGDTPVPIALAPPLPLHPPGAGKKGLELGRGSSSSLSRHSPQQHSQPNGSSGLSRRAFLVLEEAEEAGQAVTPSCPLGIPSRRGRAQEGWDELGHTG